MLCEDAAFFFDRMIASCCRLRKGTPQPMICAFVEGLWYSRISGSQELKMEPEKL